MGGSFFSSRVGEPSESTNSLTIGETDLPRREDSGLARRTRSSSIRSVSLVFMTYIVTSFVRLVNLARAELFSLWVTRMKI